MLGLSEEKPAFDEPVPQRRTSTAMSPQDDRDGLAGEGRNKHRRSPGTTNAQNRCRDHTQLASMLAGHPVAHFLHDVVCAGVRRGDLAGVLKSGRRLP